MVECPQCHTSFAALVESGESSPFPYEKEGTAKTALGKRSLLRKPSPKHVAIGCALGMVLALIVFFICLGLIVNLNNQTKGSEAGAFVAAKGFVRQKLDFPEEAEFSSGAKVRWSEARPGTPAHPQGTWSVVGDVVAKNAFGVRIRYRYRCLVTHIGNDKWDCLGEPFLGAEEE
jgi:hypothetical protein